MVPSSALAVYFVVEAKYSFLLTTPFFFSKEKKNSEGRGRGGWLPVGSVKEKKRAMGDVSDLLIRAVENALNYSTPEVKKLKRTF